MTRQPAVTGLSDSPVGILNHNLPAWVSQPPIEAVVFAWGASEDHQLGLDTTDPVPLPKVVESLLGLRFRGREFRRTPLIGGSRNTLAIDADGQLWSWGWNARGTLGHGHREAEKKPRMVSALRGVRIMQAAVGGWHCLAMDDKGQVYCWGGNEYQQCDQLVPERDLLYPQPCMSGLRVTQVACGGMSSMVLTDTGDVWAWGEPWGDFALALSRAPTKVAGAQDIRAIACGAFHNLALSRSGEVYTWGTNDYGQLGNGSTSYSMAPCKVVDLEEVPISDIAAGGWHSVALSADGSVIIWGRGEYGRLGIGDRTGSSKLRPYKVRGLEGLRVVQVTAGGTHTMALTDTGRMYIWGRASYGRLGLEGRKDAYSPEECQLPGGTERWKIAAITCGGRHSMCLAVPVRDHISSGNGMTAAAAVAPVPTAAGAYSNGAGVVGNGGRGSSWFSGGSPAVPAAATAAAVAGGFHPGTSSGSLMAVQQQQQQGYALGGSAAAGGAGSPVRRTGSTGGPLPPWSPPKQQQQQQQASLPSSQQMEPSSMSLPRNSIAGISTASSLARYQSGSMGVAAGGTLGSLRTSGGSAVGLNQLEEQHRSLSRRGSAGALAALAGEGSIRGLAVGEAMPMSPRGYMPPMSPSQSRTFASYTHSLSEYVEVDQDVQDGEDEPQADEEAEEDYGVEEGDEGNFKEQGMIALNEGALAAAGSTPGTGKAYSEASTRSTGAAGGAGEVWPDGTAAGVTGSELARRPSPAASSYEGDRRELGDELQASFVFEVNPASNSSEGISSAPTMAHLPNEALQSAFIEGAPPAAVLVGAHVPPPAVSIATGAGGNDGGAGRTMGSPLALAMSPRTQQIVTSNSSSSQRPLDSPPGVSGETLAVHMAELQLGVQRAGSLGMGDVAALSGSRPRSPGLSLGLSVEPGRGSPGLGPGRWGSGSVAVPGLVGGGLGSGTGSVGAGGVPSRVGSPSIMEPEVALTQLEEHERQQRAQQAQQQQHLAQEGMHPRMAYMLRQDSLTDIGPEVGESGAGSPIGGSSHGGSPRPTTYDVGVGETDSRGANNLLPERANMHLTSHLG